MPPSSQRIRAILEARDRASPTFNKVAGALTALGAVAVAVGVTQLGRKLVQGVQAAVAAASEQEAAEVRLAQALRLTGRAAAEVLPDLKAQASALQDLTGIGDEAILSNQSLLVSLGKLEGEGLQRATKASLDLAAATGVSQRTAFDLVAKAATGYTGTLSRYGILIDQTLPASEKFSAALDKIEGNFGGQAVAALNTYNGRLAEFQGRLGDLQEVVGGPFRDVFEAFLGEVLSPLVKDLTGATENWEGFRTAILQTALAVGEALVPFEALSEVVPVKEILKTALAGTVLKILELAAASEAARQGGEKLGEALLGLGGLGLFGNLALGAKGIGEGIEASGEAAEVAELKTAAFVRRIRELLAGEEAAGDAVDVSTTAFQRFGDALKDLGVNLKDNARTAELAAEALASLDDPEVQAGLARLGQDVDAVRTKLEELSRADYPIGFTLEPLSEDPAQVVGDLPPFPIEFEPIVDLDAIRAPFADLGTQLGIEIDPAVIPKLEKVRQALESMGDAPLTAETLQWMRALEGVGEELLEKIAPGFRQLVDEDLITLQEALEELGEDGFEPMLESLVEAGVLFDELSNKPVSMSEALRIFVEEGALALSTMLQDQTVEFETFSQTVGQLLRGQLVTAAGDLGRTLVDAATGSKVSWKEFFTEFLKRLAAAIAQALILRTILSLIPGGQAAAVPAATAAASSALQAQRGMIVPARGLQGVDSVGVLTTPGEMILPVAISSMLQDAANYHIRGQDRNGAGGAGGGAGAGRPVNLTLIQENHVEALDGPSVARVLEDSVADLPDVMERLLTQAYRRGVLSG